jgi:hypothetical protein
MARMFRAMSRKISPGAVTSPVTNSTKRATAMTDSMPTTGRILSIYNPAMKQKAAIRHPMKTIRPRNMAVKL